MGISEADLAFIASLGDKPRRVCDLGDQDLICNNTLVFDSLGLKTPSTSGKARDFWKAIGVDYLALDIVGEATHFDLNTDSIKPEWGQFDLVTNCGDSEHIINQVNFFTVMHDLTKVGGVMYHALPIAGYSFHGFFNYNPKFFLAIAKFNGYDIISIQGSVGGEKEPNAIGGHEGNKLFSRNGSIRVAFRKKTGNQFVLPLDLPEEPSTPVALSFRHRAMRKLRSLIA